MEVEHKEVLSRLRQKYGNMKQLYVTIEELGELSAALASFTLNRSEDTREGILDEVSDCYIVMEHAKGILDTEIEDSELKFQREKIKSIPLYDLTSFQVEREAYINIGNAIRLLSKLARCMSEGTEAPIQYKIRVREAIKSVYSALMYCQIRASLEGTWIDNRINSKVERLSRWIVNDVSFKETMVDRKVADIKGDMNV